jgi:sterol desaturase/sphingolipid hydroxylase (fatty acid hydroxylase superfamily)
MIDFYGILQEWLMQNIVLPLLYAVDGMGYADDSIVALDWLLFGLFQILVIAFVLRPLEDKGPQLNAPSSPGSWKSHLHTDIIYTLIHRLGIFRLVLFFIFAPIFFWFEANLHDLRFIRLNVENWWPSLTSIPWVSFLIYLIILDFAEYIYHRASHHWGWWWQLHALHHSQRYMTSWTDNRNHILDDLGHSAVFAFIALAIGVEPIEFLWLSATSQLIQSWQHGRFNIDLSFAKYILVSPNFHRLHHAIGLGYEVPGKPGVLGGCNFGVLFPWWDILLGTAIFDNKIYPTGVKDLDVSPNLFIQQWQGITHSVRQLWK